MRMIPEQSHFLCQASNGTAFTAAQRGFAPARFPQTMKT